MRMIYLEVGREAATRHLAAVPRGGSPCAKFASALLCVGVSGCGVPALSMNGSTSPALTLHCSRPNCRPGSIPMPVSRGSRRLSGVMRSNHRVEMLCLDPSLARGVLNFSGTQPGQVDLPVPGRRIRQDHARDAQGRGDVDKAAKGRARSEKLRNAVGSPKQGLDRCLGNCRICLLVFVRVSRGPRHRRHERVWAAVRIRALAMFGFK